MKNYLHMILIKTLEKTEMINFTVIAASTSISLLKLYIFIVQ